MRHECAKTDPATAVRAAAECFTYALNALFPGDAVPMEKVWSHREGVSLMSPFGGHLTGWPALQAQFARESHMGLVGRVAWHDMVVHLDSDGDIAWVAGYIAGNFTMKNGQPGMVNERATAIFEREEGQWKMIHLQADLNPDMAQAK